MIFFKPNICFKLKTLDETTLDLISRLKTSNNSYELSVLKEFVKDTELTFDNVKNKIKTEYNFSVLQGDKQLQSIGSYWTKIEQEFFNVLSNVLDVDMFGEVQAYCLLDCIPLPYVDFSAKKISLPIHESLDNNVRFALGMLVKIFLLRKFVDNIAGNVELSYNKDSVYWIMADLVADSLFFHTKRSTPIHFFTRHFQKNNHPPRCPSERTAV